ncbi:MAG: aminoglycoside phosphotransferase family protein [Clostridiales bacterium]|jgi:Ser/Thr protein kinase RdoA (MazF antagonist)|nr:aminoglycoside phosphotransferase family protein [Clostridiales bacterium]
MLKQAYEFQISGRPLSCESYGNGHINETYLLKDSNNSKYILQKINTNVFRDPESLMRNVEAVTAHFKKNGAGERECLTLVPALSGQNWHVDGDGQYWRMYDFVRDSICLEKAERPEDFRESGAAFGQFQRRMADFPAQRLIETIQRFHDTPNRYALLRGAVAADSAGRASAVRREIDFALAREDYAGLLVNLQASGEMPARVTHNDTKMNNVLLDGVTRKALCVVDLDTVMPGLAVNDFGDSIRFGASSAAEDEPDLDRVAFVPELFEAYTDGFLSACGASLTHCELEHMRDGAKMMTLEVGVRFLTDYLSGDVYFRTSRPDHNLDRCRTQFKLVRDMERHWDHMQRIILSKSL